LGCTHFPYFKEEIKQYFLPGTDIIDGNDGTVQNLKNILFARKLLENNNGNIDFYISGRYQESNSIIEKYFSIIK